MATMMCLSPQVARYPRQAYEAKHQGQGSTPAAARKHGDHKGAGEADERKTPRRELSRTSQVTNRHGDGQGHTQRHETREVVVIDVRPEGHGLQFTLLTEEHGSVRRPLERGEGGLRGADHEKRQGEATARVRRSGAGPCVDRRPDHRHRKSHDGGFDGEDGRHALPKHELSDSEQWESEGEAHATGNLGGVFGSRGHWAETRAHFERHLALAREIGYRRGEARATGNLGEVLFRLGRLGDAREHIERCLALSREIGDRHGEGFAIQSLADLSAEEGDAAAAERGYAEALALRRDIGHRDGEAETLRARGALLARRARADEARADLDAALAIARNLALARVELLATAELARLPGGDVGAALAALAALAERAGAPAAMEARFLLWKMTHDGVHLIEAKRLLDHLVAHAPEQCRETMLANVSLHRDIAAAAKEAGL